MTVAGPGERALRLFAALAHPLRGDLLEALGDEILSPAELAARVGEPLPNVIHHVGRLRELGLIELVETRVKQNTVQHFYRRLEPLCFSAEDFAPLGANAHRLLLAHGCRAGYRDAARALRDGDESTVRAEHVAEALDERAWEQIGAAVENLHAELEAIRAAALARIAEPGAVEPRSVRPASVMLAKFRAAAGPGRGR